MRKMKKINGYLVVKFNARELREYEGTALGEYGVIDAELYTGILDIDRGAMEYDNAGSMEEAVELARGLESELDTEEPEVKVTIVKETDETTEEEEVDAQQMIAGWENTLRGQVASPHYKDVDARTAAHELYGYKAALRDLGLLDREDCFVLPDTFGAWPGREERTTFKHLHPELKRHRETAQIYALGLALAADCPPNDCRVTSTSSTGPGSWTPPWTTWTRKALRRSPCGRRSENGSESWRRCSTGTSPSSSIGRRRDHERVRPL